MAASEVLRIGGVYNSGIGEKGKAAVDLWATWANSGDNTNNFTVEMEWVEYTNDSDLATTVAGFASTKHVIIPPYTSGLTGKTVDAVPEGSNVTILCWGGAADSIYSTNCVGRQCFGGWTVASQYIAPSLDAVHTAASVSLTVGIIKNNNGFSDSLADGAKDHIDGTTGLSMSPSTVQSISVKSDDLTESDRVTVQSVIAAAPDVVVVAGHPGDVEEVVILLQNDTYKPKAIIAVNGLIDPDHYEELGGLGVAAMQNVIMPDQWDDSTNAKDSIVGWTSADFKTALGDDATYHSASAGGLAVALTHAMASGDVGSRVDEIASLMAALAPTQTFYGKLSWVQGGNGRLDETADNGKPMYGKQQQSANVVVVAPTGPIVYPMYNDANDATTTGTNDATTTDTKDISNTDGGMRAGPVSAPFVLLSALVAFAG